MPKKRGFVMKYKKPKSITRSKLSIFKDFAYPSITSTLLAATITFTSSSTELFSFNVSGSVAIKFALNLFL